MKNTIIVADTETIGLPPKNFVFDLGYTVADKKGNILFEANHLVEEIVTDGKLMMGAFYAKKIFSHYLPLVETGFIDIQPWHIIIEELRDIIATYNINIFSAYNLGFDMRAMAATQNKLAQGKILQDKIQLLDLWQFSCEVLLNRPTYKTLAEQQGWKSPAGNFRTTAEHSYRYISGYYEAEEQHTALCDARIETKIMSKCYRQNKKVPYGVFDAHPWRIVNA